MMCEIKQNIDAYIDNKLINIDDFENNEELSKRLKCKYGHELEFVKCNKKKSYFRHKNNCDVIGYDMSEWHKEWQKSFENIEIYYKKTNDDQYKNRRADVVLNNSEYIIEFQNSKISYEDVNKRKLDYKKHNKKIIWVINGENTIEVSIRNNNNQYLVFLDQKWKYESFIDYDYIFIDIDTKIYKINPKYIKNAMIDISKIFEKKEFIDCLKNNKFEKIYENHITEYQSILYIRQQGAGNGKTYDLLQQLDKEEFEHYKYFIIVTKLHSAKSVIYNELIDQIKKEKYQNILILNDEKNGNKKHEIKLRNKKTGNNIYLLISSIDSFMYLIGNNNNNFLDKFKGVVTSIWKDGYIKLQNKKIKLNKELCLFVDETQDLDENYGISIIELMKTQYIDTYIVGDKLQSINNENNTFDYLLKNDFSKFLIKKIELEKKNVCRRFIHNDIIELINKIVPFENDDYGNLPKIQGYKIDNEPNKTHVEIFEGNEVYLKDEKTKKGIIKIASETNQIMNLYIKEVEENNCTPEDFLIITPYTNFNPLACQLEIAIESFWQKKHKTSNKDYVYFHKSDEGTSIDLNLSEKSTRIVSIHTSKGDGRKIVFIIGMDEKSLKKFSNYKENLIYHSLIHVALTRVKERMYIRIHNKKDDIAKKFLKNIDYDFNINLISPRINYNNIINQLSNNEKIFEEIYKNIIEKSTNEKIVFDEKHSKLIDMDHHKIRYMTIYIILLIKIVSKINNKDEQLYIYTCLTQIRDYWLKETNSHNEYYEFLENKLQVILKIDGYEKEFENIKQIIINIKHHIDKILKGNKQYLCPLECIVLYYLISIQQNGKYTNITMIDLYRLYNIYEKSFNNTCKGHKYCICKKIFKNNILQLYIFNHYESANKIYEQYINLMKKYPKIKWRLSFNVFYKGNNSDYTIFNKYEIIGEDNKNFFIVNIKPSFNEINYNKELFNSVFDTFLFKNSNIEKKFQKNIKTIIISLNNNTYFEFDWGNLLIYENFKLWIKEQIINECCFAAHDIYMFYKNIIEIFKDSKVYSYDNFNNQKKINLIIKAFEVKYNDKTCDKEKLLKLIKIESSNDKSLKKFPMFLLNFLKNIKLDELDLYNDNVFFIENLQNEIKNNIEKFFI